MELESIIVRIPSVLLLGGFISKVSKSSDQKTPSWLEWPRFGTPTLLAHVFSAKMHPMTTRPAWDVCLWTLLKRKRLLNWEHSKKGNEVGRSQNYSRISKKDSNVVNLVNPTSPQKRQNVLWQTMAMYVWLFVSSFQHEAQGFPPSSLPPHCLPASRSARGVCATGDASSRTRKILRWIGHFPVWDGSRNP